MKLITKFLLIYLFVSTLVLGVGGVISYYIIKAEIDKELTFEFMDRIDRVTYLIEKGKKFKGQRGVEQDENLVIQALPNQLDDRVEVTDTLIWDNRLEQEERNVKVTAYRTINDTTYYISTYGNMIESDDIKEAVVTILLWILGLQVAGAIGIGYFVSGPLFRPFRETLNKIKGFSLQEKEPIEAVQTSVREFDDLNKFVEDMTGKAISDYQNLKEFAENASHEIQTPLSIVQGKLELLTETPLNNEQYKYVEDTQRSIKKLSRLSESLGLLTKIENYEFTGIEDVNFTKLIRESVESFSEFIELNNLALETNLQENVTIKFHPALADILWTNLFQNAIKHNIEEGEIEIELTQKTLRISNTGKPLKTDPGLLFERFKKADQSMESIGLGLSIVKQIISQYNFSIDYTHENGMHHIRVSFN